MKTLIIFFLLCSFTASACLNIYGVDENGHEHFNEISYFQFTPQSEKEIKSNLRKIERKLLNNKKSDSLYFQLISNYAYWLTKAGYYNEALEIYKGLIKRKPNEYIINSNLGTVYELTGGNDSAFYYVEKSIKLNPNSHKGSEWLHLNILKAKLNKLDVLKTEITKNDSSNFSYYHIIYQLRERIPFSKKGDLIVAKIFKELGDSAAKNHSLHYALLYYKLSYGYSLGQWDFLIDKIQTFETKCLEIENKATKTAYKNFNLKPKLPEIEIIVFMTLRNKPIYIENWYALKKETIFKQLNT